MNAVDVARTLVEHAADALLVSSLGTAISALRRTSNDGPHFYFGGAMGSTVAPIAAETRFAEVAQSSPHLAAARARSTEELASRLSTLPRPELLKVSRRPDLARVALPLRRPSSREGALRRTRERR